MAIPAQGRKPEDILKDLRELKKDDIQWRNGRLFSYIYHPGDEGEALLKAAYTEYLTENGIDPTSFPSLVHMENDVIGFMTRWMRGDENTVGHLTTGGTESLLLSLKTARDRARMLQPHITKPEVILPFTVHSSFFKACSYFDLVPVVTPVGSDFRADVEAIRNAITENTILIAASAPSYAFGVVDPIREIGEIALEKNLLFHVDACIGGFIVGGTRLAGMPSVDFDFSVPGVTSISVDIHKYGYAGKGCSALLYKNDEIRKYQYFVCADWTGYSIVNPTMLSSKTAGPVAGAWAMFNYFGEEGYVQLAKETVETTQRLAAGINKIEGLKVLGGIPEASLFSFICDDTGLNIFELNDEMQARGWKVQLQLGTNVAPANIHLTVNKSHIGIEPAFLADLAASVESIRSVKPSEVKVVMHEELSGEVTEQALFAMLTRLGIDPGNLPKRMAIVNEVLDLLPPPVVKELLGRFMQGVYRPALEVESL
jgi:sphinganine-1-phosphate aldolase